MERLTATGREHREGEGSQGSGSALQDLQLRGEGILSGGAKASAVTALVLCRERRVCSEQSHHEEELEKVWVGIRMLAAGSEL